MTTTPEEDKSHLEPQTSGRGFKHFPEITSTYGGNTRLVESSSAEGPHVFLFVECPVDLNQPHGPVKEATQHFRLEDAVKLAEQILYLNEHHYQHKYYH